MLHQNNRGMQKPRRFGRLCDAEELAALGHESDALLRGQWEPHARWRGCNQRAWRDIGGSEVASMRDVPCTRVGQHDRRQAGEHPIERNDRRARRVPIAFRDVERQGIGDGQIAAARSP